MTIIFKIKINVFDGIAEFNEKLTKPYKAIMYIYTPILTFFTPLCNFSFAYFDRIYNNLQM